MDIRFSLFDFPVRVHLWFFLTAWFIGPRTGPVHEQLLWIVCVALGILVHELGHALTARRAGFSPEIELHGMGGLTRWVPTRRLSRLGEAAITAAGPAVGIAVGAVFLVASLWLEPAPDSLTWTLFRWAWFVTLGWGVLNLLPINPLDGGRLAVLLAGVVWPARGPMLARLLSLVVAAVLALWALKNHWTWGAIILAVLMFSNIQEIRRDMAGPDGGMSERSP